MKNNFTPIQYDDIKRIGELSVKPITKVYNVDGFELERIAGHEITIKTCDVSVTDEIVKLVMEKLK